MSDSVRLFATGFTITLMVDLSPSLRALLMQLLHPLPPAAPDTVSRDVPVTAVARKASQAAPTPGPALTGVSSLENPPAASKAPRASFQKPKRKSPTKRALLPLPFETPERVEWLRSAWCDRGINRRDIWMELNKMDGPKLPKEWNVNSLLKRHNIQRSPEKRRELHLAKAVLMRTAIGRNKGGAPATAAPSPAVAVVGQPSSTERRAAGMSAAQVITKRNGTAAKPRAATSVEILRWGAEHGCTQDKLDLDAMNAHCRKLGVAPFELITPKSRAA